MKTPLITSSAAASGKSSTSFTRRAQATAAEVQTALPDPPSYSAVRAMLRILEEKGHVRHEQDGPRYVYLPTIARDNAKRSALRHMLRTFFDGSAEQAISALLDDSSANLSEAELDRLARHDQSGPSHGSVSHDASPSCCPAGIDAAWLPALDAMIKATLLFAVARPRDVGARTRVGRGAPFRLDARAHQRVAAAGALARTAALAAADHPARVIATSGASGTRRGPIDAGHASQSDGDRPAVARRIATTPQRRRVPRGSAARRGSRHAPDLAVRANVDRGRGSCSIWAAGAFAVIARLIAGLVAVQWMSRRTAQVIDAPWLPLAIELASQLGVSRRLRLRREPRRDHADGVGRLQAVGADARGCRRAGRSNGCGSCCCTSWRTSSAATA